MCFGSPLYTTTEKRELPPFLEDAYKQLTQQARAVTDPSVGYVPYGGQRLAPLSFEQQYARQRAVEQAQAYRPDLAQARSLTYPQAFALESQYKFDPKYAGADKTSRLGYIKQGLQSLVGIQQPGSNVGGATPLTRKLALDVGEKVLPTVAKGVTALTSLPASTDRAIRLG